MTVSSEVFETPYTTQGLVNETFPTVFAFFDAAEVFYFLDGTLQVLGTNYSVTGGQGMPGSVVHSGTPTAGKAVLIIRRHPTTQGGQYAENDGFPAEAHEDNMDRLGMAEQAALRLSTADPRVYDAGTGGGTTRRIVNVKDPVDDQDATTKKYVGGLTALSGSIPTPTAPDVGKYLKATSAAPPPTGVGWDAPREVPIPGGGEVGEVLTVTGAGVYGFEPLPAAAGATFPFNFAINGQFLISQRAGAGGTHAAGSAYPNNDDAYTLDRWILLSNGNNIVSVAHEGTVVPDGAQFSLKATVVTANAKFGFVTILEGSLTRRMRRLGTSSKCSLRFKHRTPAANRIRNIRAAVVPWGGAEDAPVSDLVSAWNAEGANPTLAGSWGPFEEAGAGPPANIAVTQDAWGETVIQNITVDTATVTNLALFVWCDDADAAIGDILYLADIHLESGAVANTVIPAEPGHELDLCQRFFQAMEVDTIDDPLGTGICATGVLARIHIAYLRRMRVVPTFLYSAAATFRIEDTTNRVATAISLIQATRDAARHQVTVAGPMVAGDGALLKAETTAARIFADAEL
jgi:hypothetical protein